MQSSPMTLPMTPLAFHNLIPPPPLISHVPLLHRHCLHFTSRGLYLRPSFSPPYRLQTHRRYQICVVIGPLIYSSNTAVSCSVPLRHLSLVASPSYHFSRHKRRTSGVRHSTHLDTASLGHVLSVSLINLHTQGCRSEAEATRYWHLDRDGLRDAWCMICQHSAALSLDGSGR